MAPNPFMAKLCYDLSWNRDWTGMLIVDRSTMLLQIQIM